MNSPYYVTANYDSDSGRVCDMSVTLPEHATLGQIRDTVNLLFEAGRDYQQPPVPLYPDPSLADTKRMVTSGDSTGFFPR